MLDDLGDGATVSETVGLSVEQAAAALELLESGPVANIDAFVEAVGVGDHDVDNALRDVGRTAVAAMAESWEAPHTFVHGDFRADNLVYDGGGAPLIIDWQLCSRQGPARDVASLLLGSVTTEVRRANEEDLLVSTSAPSELAEWCYRNSNCANRSPPEPSWTSPDTS